MHFSDGAMRRKHVFESVPKAKQPVHEVFSVGSDFTAKPRELSTASSLLRWWPGLLMTCQEMKKQKHCSDLRLY